MTAQRPDVAVIGGGVTLAEVDAAAVVVAAGCATAALTGLPVRPVKGQLLRLRAPDGSPGLRHVVRGVVDGRGIYLAPGRYVATGHYRHGVLLAPVTADAMAELVATGTAPDVIAPFRVDRFALADTMSGGSAW